VRILNYFLFGYDPAGLNISRRFMDPEVITTAIWADISWVLRFLWLFWFFIIGFATHMLLAHALIPSLVSSGQLPESFGRVRPMIYLGGLGALLLAIISLVVSISGMGFINDFWTRWWI
jgi:hypothetical protein